MIIASLEFVCDRDTPILDVLAGIDLLAADSLPNYKGYRTVLKQQIRNKDKVHYYFDVTTKGDKA